MASGNLEGNWDVQEAACSGQFPASSFTHLERSFSVYIHVPFCHKRCGYCDFATFTNADLGSGASSQKYAQTLIADIEQTAAYFAGNLRPVSTVFFGGGTPTFLPASDLAAMLRGVADTFGLLPGAEVTTEANPDTVNFAYLEQLKKAGFTRLSVGMQSGVERILKIIDRTHNSEQIVKIARWAKELDLQFSLDLIYATPGERLAEWRQSLQMALEIEPDHISCYALGIEPGTKMGQQLRRGQIEPVDDDYAAACYQLADDMLNSAGYKWYEISNWARPDRQCRHNLAYWTNQDWWGFGPSSHSHLGDFRCWNLRHPHPWSQQVLQGKLPLLGGEILDQQAQNLEDLYLHLRLSQGMSLATALAKNIFTSPEIAAEKCQQAVADGLLEAPAWEQNQIRVTVTGRLLLDTIIADLLS